MLTLDDKALSIAEDLAWNKWQGDLDEAWKARDQYQTWKCWASIAEEQLVSAMGMEYQEVEIEEGCLGRAKMIEPALKPASQPRI